MSEKFEIGGQGTQLVVKVLGYENPSAQDISDANWLNCQVLLSIGQHFCADFPASFTTSDFVRFREELRTVLRKLDGTASFLTDEDGLKFSIEMSRTGKAVVEGVAQSYDQPKASLAFLFETDQTFLQETLHHLSAVLAHFPVNAHSFS